MTWPPAGRISTDGCNAPASPLRFACSAPASTCRRGPPRRACCAESIQQAVRPEIAGDQGGEVSRVNVLLARRNARVASLATSRSAPISAQDISPWASAIGSSGHWRVPVPAVTRQQQASLDGRCRRTDLRRVESPAGDKGLRIAPGWFADAFGSTRLKSWCPRFGSGSRHSETASTSRFSAFWGGTLRP
jgi:hypothetical protein